MSWEKTIGRVSFINCEPLFFNLPSQWSVLSAPPSWLTGHLLRRDCIIAPIPAADFAKHKHELYLIPDIAISSKGEVGSVLLFGKMEISKMKSIALPTDSATSCALLQYLMSMKGNNVKYQEMGPDLGTMLSNCDGCLLIGDRALESAKLYPEYVKMDLGKEWRKSSGSPMVFGVFAARRDSNIDLVKSAYNALLTNLERFENSKSIRNDVIVACSAKTNQSTSRLERYFGEVINRVDSDDITGLKKFLSRACNVDDELTMAW